MSKKKRTNYKTKDSNLIPQEYLTSLAKRDPTAKTRGELIKNAMKKKRLSVADVAKKSGLSIYLFTAFMGGRVNITQEQLDKIVKLLDLDYDDLMTVIPVSPVDKVKESFSERQKELIQGAKNISEDIGTEPDDLNTEPSSNTDVSKPTDNTLEPINEQVANEEKPKVNSGQNAETLIPAKEETDEWIPSGHEINALLVLCTEHGKAKVYRAIWNILQDPTCRKGGVIND